MLENYSNISKKSVFISFIVLIALVFSVKMHFIFIQFIDQMFSSFIQGSFFGFLEPIMRLITNIANTKLGFVYAILIAGYLWFKNHRVDSVWVLATMLGGSAVAFLLKHFVQRPRPTIDQLVPETGFSMPSGHTFEAFLVLAFIYLYFVRPMQESTVKNVCVRLLVLWQILVMWSRIYMGAHYLTDTITSVVLGVVWLWFAIILYHRFYGTIEDLIQPVIGSHSRRN